MLTRLPLLWLLFNLFITHVCVLPFAASSWPMCVFYLFITYVCVLPFYNPCVCFTFCRLVVTYMCVLPFYNLCVFYLLPPRRNLMLLCAEWENKKQHLTYTRKPCPKSTLQTVHTHRVGQKRTCTPCIGLARTIYIRCMYGIFGRGITKYTVIYDVYIRFWPTLAMYVRMFYRILPKLPHTHRIYTDVKKVFAIHTAYLNP